MWGFFLIGLFTLASATGAATLPTPQLQLEHCAPESRFAGARLECAIEARTDRPPPVIIPPVDVPTFFEIHSAQVQHAMLFFRPLPGDRFAQARARDRVRLWHPPQPMGSALATSIGAFGGAILAAAHAPAPLRYVFDAPLHLGPAVFTNSGGMGVGLGFSF